MGTQSRPMTSLALAVLAFICVVPGVAIGQTTELIGNVADGTKLPVMGAVVTLEDELRAQRFQATTDAGGQYVFATVPVGRYTLTVTAQGFVSYVASGVVLSVGERSRLNVRLTLSNVQEQVEVRASTTRTNGSLGTVVGREFVENLPLNGRSFLPLIALTPGVTLTPASFGNEGQFSVNGQRPDANYFQIDGVSANVSISAGAGLNASAGGSLPGVSATGGMSNLISLEAMEEFRIETSSFAPEFGRTPGGQVSIVSRAGSNRLSGSVFEYYRTDKLDATDWFTNRSGQPKPRLRQHDIGGVVGGAILRDRLFFFASGERLRLDLPKSGIANVPSRSVRDSAPAAVKPYLNAFALPTGADVANGLAEYAYALSDTSALDALSGRLDFTTGATRLFVRLAHSPSEFRELLPATDRLVDTDTNTATVGFTSLFGGTHLDLRANYSGNTTANEQVFMTRNGAIAPADADILPSFASLDDALVSLVIPGTSYSAGRNVRNRLRQINVVATGTRQAGTHLLKAGVDWRYLTPQSGPRSYGQTVRFNAVADLLAGRISRLTVASIQPTEFHVHNVSLFAQDAWNLTSATTVTYGLRWDIEPAPGTPSGAEAPAAIAFDDLAAIDVAPAGTALWRTRYGNIAPRIGISHRFGAEGRTVLRGGVGRFYDLSAKGAGSLLSVGFPFTGQRNVDNVLAPAPAAALAPPAIDRTTKPYAGFVNLADPDLRAPVSTQWNVTVERELWRDQTVSLAYVGARGDDLLRVERYGAANASFTDLRRIGNGGRSEYDGLQVEVRRRPTHGVSILGHYALGQSNDTESSLRLVLPAARVGEDTEFGPSDYDIRHSASVAVHADMGALVTPRLGGWSVDAIWRIRSGAPVNIITGLDSFGLGATDVVRPDLVSGVPIYLDDATAPGGQRINRAAFVLPPAGRQGTFPRNGVRGYSAQQLDLSLTKQIRLIGTTAVDLRVDCFNLFNIANFGPPGGNLNAAATFGVPSTTLNRQLGSSGVGGGFDALYQMGGPRSIQLSVKGRF